MKRALVLILMMVSLGMFAQATIHGPSPYAYLTSMIAYDPNTGIIYGWNGTTYVALLAGSTGAEADPLSYHTGEDVDTGEYSVTTTGLVVSGAAQFNQNQLWFQLTGPRPLDNYAAPLFYLNGDIANLSMFFGVGNTTTFAPTGIHNTTFGRQSGWQLSSGNLNTFMGTHSGFETTTGAQNTFYGNEAGFYVSTGSYNTLVGCYAGIDVLTQSYNTLVGAGTNIGTGHTNATAVGANAITTASNSVQLGDASVTSAKVGTADVVLTAPGASGNVLISNGSIWTSALPPWLTTEVDGTVGNEVVGATPSGGLTRTGSGTSGDPYTLALNLGNANTWTAAQTIDGTADAIQLLVQGHSTQTANVFEVQSSTAAYLFKVSPTGVASVAGTLNAGGNINGSGNMAYSGEAVNNAMTPSAWTGFGQKFNFAAAPGASNVAVLDTAANSRARKGVTTDTATAVLGVVDGAGSAVTAVIIFGGITKVNCDAVNVARGDTLVVSTATDGCAMTNNSETNPKLIVGYALEEKTTGSAGLVAVWVK